MSEEIEDSPNKPSDNAEDILESVKISTALSVFNLNIQRIKGVLDVTDSGIKDNAKNIDEISLKLSGPHKKAKSTNKEKARILENGMIELSLTENELDIIKRAMSYRLKFIEDLPFYINNILLAATWSALEGYVQARLAELYSYRTNLLSSDKKITVAEIVNASENLIGYLVAKEIDDVGRKSFTDLQIYLKSKIKLQFSNTYANLLRDAYFLRNVIAHSAGFLRPDQINLVPDGVDTNGSELRISKVYLNALINCIQKAVSEFDKNVFNKFYTPTLDIIPSPARDEPTLTEGQM